MLQKYHIKRRSLLLLYVVLYPVVEWSEGFETWRNPYLEHDACYINGDVYSCLSVKKTISKLIKLRSFVNSGCEPGLSVAIGFIHYA
ncbi:MAG: hypothetical protein OIF57_00270 [Marinobacterium sp.]|nr:hypothetical protein [Marinobacterium sp.]